MIVLLCELPDGSVRVLSRSGPAPKVGTLHKVEAASTQEARKKLTASKVVPAPKK